MNFSKSDLSTFLGSSDSFFCEQIENSKIYLRPINIVHVKNKLKREGYESVDSYLQKYSLKEARKIFNSIANSFKVSGLNPHKDYEPTQFYLETDLINVITEKIVEFLEEPSIAAKCIVHVGNKGTGKTVTQNIFLKEKHDWLEENNIFWVRCDVHKLYDKIYGENFQKMQVTITEYLNLQLLYVFLKYCKTSKLLLKIYNEIRESNKMYDDTIGHSEDSKKPTKIIDSIIKFRDDVLGGEQNNSHIFDYSYMIEKIILNSSTANRPRSFIRWIELSGAIQGFMREKGYKILFIVDALDNILLSSEESIKKYRNVIEQYLKFINKRPINDNYMHWASIRPRTKQEFDIINTSLLYSKQYLNKNEIYEIDHEKFDKSLFGKILDKRINFIDLKHRFTKQNIDEKIIFELIQKIIENDINNQNLNENYHENCRAYLLNNLNMVKFLYYRWNEDGRQSGEYTKANELLDQALILSNQIYFDSENFHSTGNDDGNYAFNIFYYKHNNFVETNSNMIQWQGLCCTRILQLLMTQILHQSTKENIINYLHKNFQYSKNVINFSIELLREYAFVDSELGKLDGNGDSIILFEISEKGKFLFNKIYSSLEMIYYFSLDTYVPKFLCDDQLIDSHTLEKHKPSDYHLNCIKSSLSFIKFILFIEDVEKKKFLNNNNKNLNHYDLFFQVINSDRIEKYLTFIRNSEKYLDEFQKTVITDLIKSTIQGGNN